MHLVYRVMLGVIHWDSGVFTGTAGDAMGQLVMQWDSG